MASKGNDNVAYFTDWADPPDPRPGIAVRFPFLFFSSFAYPLSLSLLTTTLPVVSGTGFPQVVRSMGTSGGQRFFLGPVLTKNQVTSCDQLCCGHTGSFTPCATLPALACSKPILPCETRGTSAARLPVISIRHVMRLRPSSLSLSRSTSNTGSLVRHACSGRVMQFWQGQSSGALVQGHRRLLKPPEAKSSS